MSGVGILCFTASYALAFGLEISRFFIRIPFRTGQIVFWTLAGLTAHTAYLYYHHAVSRGPVDGAESYFLVSAWGLTLVYLYLFCFHPKTPFGLVLWPIVLLLIGGAAVASVPTDGQVAPAASVDIALFWKRLHAATFFLATLAICVGFVAGVLYLIQDARLRRKRPPMPLFQLPALEWSLAVCRRAMGASIFLLASCIFSGLLLRAQGSATRNTVSWTDPLILGTILMFAFLLPFSGVLSAGFFKKKGRDVAVLTLVGFLFLVFILVFALVFQSSHWKQSPSPGPTPCKEVPS